MKLCGNIKKIWHVLDRRGRRQAAVVLVAMIAGALASAVMVGSIFPFLSVLSDPERIRESGALFFLYEFGGFTTDYDFVVALGLASIAIIFISNGMLILQTWALAHFAQMQVHYLSIRLFEHYVAQPYEFFLTRHSGSMTTNVLSEAHQAVVQFLAPLAALVASSLTVIAVIATLMVVDPKVAAATFSAFLAAYGSIIMFTRRYIQRKGRIRALANERRFRVASEAFGGIKAVKLSGSEHAYLERFDSPSKETAQSQVSVHVVGTAPRYILQIIAFGGIIILSLLLLNPSELDERQALGEALPLIGLLAFAAQRLMPEVQNLYQAITIMNAGAAAVEKVHNDLADRKTLIEDRSRRRMGLNKCLRLENVSFSYPNTGQESLKNVNFTLVAGERIGVVGVSGAGKTTLADVVLGLLVPNSGAVYVDDVRIGPENLGEWQRSVGYVPQDIFLADATLAENVAFGVAPHEIDRCLLGRAVEVANLGALVNHQLPDGYESKVGEGGVKLSGGQRQRIGIARAIYRNADLIVFDEATSALDNMTEREVMNAISSLPGEKTVLIIAHRLTTVKSCDRIIVMKQGQIVDVGPWAFLESNSRDFNELMNASQIN